jgi:hypothetical protein
VIGHVPPRLRNFDQLFFDKGIARLFGTLFALASLSAIFFCFGCQEVALNATLATWRSSSAISSVQLP